MSKPVVAVVGRPNVGKSTLFNALAGEKISIVKDTPGVTRDRIYADVTWLNYQFTLIDTGGIEPDSGDLLLSHMRGQAEIAMETADVIIFLTDVRQGLVDADYQVADMLRRSGKPIVLAVNKVDNYEKFVLDTYEFYNLGLGTPFPVSANSKIGFGDLLDEVLVHCNPQDADEKEDERPRVAIIGKPNAGKSSLLNLMLGEDRAIVTDIEGTTRDTLEENINFNGLSLKIIDTAGIRDTEDLVERIGVNKAKEIAKEGDLIIYVVDGSRELDDNDREIIKLINDKQAIILVNKSDMDTVINIDELKKDSNRDVILFSAKNGEGMDQLEEEIRNMFYSGKVTYNDQVYITNARHKEALENALESLKQVKNSVDAGMPEDFYSIDLMDAYTDLGLIIGESVEDDLVNEIFSKFCMGK